jgi:hypothetical protein
MSRQRIELVAAELALPWRGYEPCQRSFADTAEQVVRFRIVVAGLKIAIVLDRQRGATSRRKNTGAGMPDPAGTRSVKGLREDLANITLHPLVEDLRQEAADAPTAPNVP